MSDPSFAQNVKQPNVSGAFYPSDKTKLRDEIASYMNKADIRPADRPVAVIVVPHAGYVYSGPVAAYAYKFVSKQKYNTVVVLAASHYHGFDGISVGNFDAIRTPLGDAPVDKKMAADLVAQDPKFIADPKVFDQEHSLEVEVPFIQTVFPDAKIVPVIFGQPGPLTVKAFAAALNGIIGKRDDVLVVVSTDLSHYHDAGTAKRMDQDVMELFLKQDAENLWKKNATRELEMCGFVPATAAIFYAKARGLSETRMLYYGNSADMTGDTRRVVGYGAMAVMGQSSSSTAEENNMDERAEKSSTVPGVADLSEAQKTRLLRIARDTVMTFVKEKKELRVSDVDPRLQLEEGAFVTLKKHGVLRGCIGNIIGQGPLYLTVRNMAISACSQDPRFPPVSESELGDIDIEISVLSKPRVAKSDDIVMGKHGVIVSRGFNGGVFLPQVATETGWSKEEFLSELCSQKAGLPRDCWKDPRVKIEIFTADVFGE